MELNDGVVCLPAHTTEYAGAVIVTLVMGVAFEYIRNVRPKVAKLLAPKKCCKHKNSAGSVTSITSDVEDDDPMLMTHVKPPKKYVFAFLLWLFCVF